mmetsp:Transcript_24243/g.45107  ORF Transcript_24243/g.45107 Transcript_24243/m.45107 type:complete len:459 (+) Transcript_24243:371-1747(+)
MCASVTTSFITGLPSSAAQSTLDRSWKRASAASRAWWTPIAPTWVLVTTMVSGATAQLLTSGRERAVPPGTPTLTPTPSLSCVPAKRTCPARRPVNRPPYLHRYPHRPLQLRRLLPVAIPAAYQLLNQLCPLVSLPVLPADARAMHPQEYRLLYQLVFPAAHPAVFLRVCLLLFPLVYPPAHLAVCPLRFQLLFHLACPVACLVVFQRGCLLACPVWFPPASPVESRVSSLAMHPVSYPAPAPLRPPLTASLVTVASVTTMVCVALTAKGASVTTQRTTGHLSTVLPSAMAQNCRTGIIAPRMNAIFTAAGWEIAPRMASLAFVTIPTTARLLTAARLGLRYRPPALVSALLATAPPAIIKELVTRLQVATSAPAMIPTVIGPPRCAKLSTSVGSWPLATAAFPVRATTTARGWVHVTPAENIAYVLTRTTVGPQSVVRYGMRPPIQSLLVRMVNALC